MTKEVALVLASGGARGLAHIGAIDLLEEYGFKITSVSGCSMGAVVGGLYAAGGLDSFKEWMLSVDKMKVFALMDFTLSRKGFVKGERVIEELKTIVPDVNIEDLPIPYCAVATDIYHRREVVFDRGSLYDAIRSSISVPSLFTPNKIGNMLLIDGGVVNPTPIDRVRRNGNDLLVVVDLNGPYVEKASDVDEISAFRRVGEYIGDLKEKIEDKIEEMRGKVHIPEEAETAEEVTVSLPDPSDEDVDMNLVEILDQSSSLMLEKNAERTIALYHPDVLVRIAKNAYSTLEFNKYEEIVELGRMKMKEALEKASLI